MSIRTVKLKPDEAVMVKVHQYGLTLCWAWFLVVIMLAIPFFFMFWLFNHGWWGQVLFFVPVMAALAFFFRTLYIWQRNIFLITTHRIIDIDRRGLFDKVITSVSYDQIEDVSGRIKGFFGTVFRYGEVVVGTGAGKLELRAVKIKNPTDLQDQINELRDEILKKNTPKYGDNPVLSMLEQINKLPVADLFKLKKAIHQRINKLSAKF